MSGGAVPYHLRQYKAVDRAVFVEVLHRVGRVTETALRDYKYVGFAGPFSEDFKIVHSQLGIARFCSIEADANVLPRQAFNSPLRGIEFRHCSSRDYVDQFNTNEPTITWLDYTNPAHTGDQLAEVQTLVGKLGDYDVLKVTFNASHTNLGPHGIDPVAIEQRITRARERLADYLPPGFEVTAEDVDKKGYPSLVLKGLELAILAGMNGQPKSLFQPITAFTYADSQHRMLTLTGILIPKGRRSRFVAETGLARWKLSTLKWEERTFPIDIVVPEMSLRERLFVDQQLPRRGSSGKIFRRLGFRLEAGGDDRTVAALASYKNFYQYFPQFSRVLL